MSTAAVSWTGGKDSALALYDAEMLGCRIDCLVTFASRQGRFLAHPLGFMVFQAQALGLPHYVIDVEEPFDRSYEDAISSLKKRRGIDALVTGDVGEVADHDPNWIVDRSARCGIDVLRPLWRRGGLELLNRLLLLKFKVIFSCVRKPWFTDEWLGLELSPSSVKRLSEINKRTGLDLCGEQGEYHTLVLDGPQFRKSIQVGPYSKHVENSLAYVSLQNLRLREKHG